MWLIAARAASAVGDRFVLPLPEAAFYGLADAGGVGGHEAFPAGEALPAG